MQIIFLSLAKHCQDSEISNCWDRQNCYSCFYYCNSLMYYYHCRHTAADFRACRQWNVNFEKVINKIKAISNMAAGREEPENLWWFTCTMESNELEENLPNVQKPEDSKSLEEGESRGWRGGKRIYDTGYRSVWDALWKTLFIHTSVFEVRTNERQRHNFKNNSEFAKFLS